MIINTNIDAMKTLRSLNANTQKTNKTMEKLSSGQKINRAADDSAGLAISAKMRAQIRGLVQDERNIEDGIHMFNTAEGGMEQIEYMINRIRELAVQSAHDTNTDEDRQKMQIEVDQLIEGIDRIANDTEFNTHKVLQGKLSGPTFTSDPVKWSDPSVLSALNDISLNWDRHNAMATGGSSTGYSPLDGALNSMSMLIVTDAQGNTIGTTNSFGIDAFIDTNYGNLPQAFVANPTLANAQLLATAIAGAMTASINATPGLAGLNLTVTGIINSDDEFSFTVEDANGNPFGIQFGGCTNQGLIDSASGDKGSIAHQFLHNTFGGNFQLGDPSQEYIIQVGPNTDQNILFRIPAMRTDAIGRSVPPPAVFIKTADISTQSDANNTIALCDIALDYVNNGRVLMGSHVNRLKTAMFNVTNAGENTSAAESLLRDAHMAKEMMEFTKANIMQQEIVSVMAKTNQRTQDVLQLLK